MDSNVKEQTENEYPIYFYIHLFFVFLGAILYICLVVLFKIYYKISSFIKLEIFTFIILNSFKSFLEITLSPSITKEFILYVIGIIEFYLILSYLNKCFTTKKISQNNSSYEIQYFCYIIIIFIFSTFPYEKIFKISEKYIFSCNTINIILAILLFRYINIKMQSLLEYLKEKKMTNSTIPDIYLPYMKAHYYYTNFRIINIIFYLCLIFAISYYAIKNVELFLEWQIVSKYLLLFTEESIYCSMIAAGLIFFYSFNKNKLLKGGKMRKKEDNTEEAANLTKFSVIDVDIQQDEKTNLSERKKPKDRNRRDEEDEEEKANNNKTNEESETLK